MGIKKLSNEVFVPCMGLGTLVENIDEQTAIDNIIYAIRQGYRLIDTAWIYKNEKSVGKAINQVLKSGEVKRDELFVQTKFYPQMPYGYDSVMDQFKESIENLGLDYVDAYLFHQPVPRYAELDYKVRNSSAWKAMEQIYEAGKAKAIGVSNFLERHIEYIAEKAQVFPIINQIEINPFFQQRGLQEWCKNKNIMIQAWGGVKAVVNDSSIIQRIALKHNVSIAQVCLRWNMQMGNIPIVSSSKRRNIKKNFQMNFVLDDDDMEKIRSCNTSTNHRNTWWYPRQQMY